MRRCLFVLHFRLPFMRPVLPIRLLRLLPIVLALLASLTVWPTAHAQWLGDTDLYLARSESGAAVFNARTGEPVVLLGIRVPEETWIKTPRDAWRGADPFDVAPNPVGPHRAMRGNTEGGWEITRRNVSQHTSPDGAHVSLTLGDHGIILNANKPREIRRYGDVWILGFLGSRGEAVAMLKFTGTPQTYGGTVKFVVHEVATDRVLYSRTYPRVGKTRATADIVRMHPGPPVPTNGAKTGRFIFMTAPGATFRTLLVYDHERREMFELPYLASSVAVSPDNRLIGVGNDVDNVIVETDTWQVVQMLKGAAPGKGLPGGMAMGGFLKDNRYFVGSPSWQALALFDVQTGRMIDMINGGSRMLETHEMGDIVAYSGGYGYALFTTIIDGKLRASDLCAKDSCRPMPGLSGSGPLHLKPDQSGFMVTMSPNLIWHDFKTGQTLKFSFDASTVQAWLNKHRDATMGAKCSFFGQACTYTMPKLKAVPGAAPIVDRRTSRVMMDYSVVSPWWTGLCEVLEGGDCISFVYGNKGGLVYGLFADDAIKAAAPSFKENHELSKARKTAHDLFDQIAVKPCAEKRMPLRCGVLVDRLVYLGELERLHTLCQEILEICELAAAFIESNIRRPLRDAGIPLQRVRDLEALGPWTEAREVQFQQIAQRACLEAIDIRSCRLIPGMKLISTYAENDLSWKKPAAQSAWAEFLPKLIERLDAEDRARGWKLTKISDAQAWARIPVSEREACKPKMGGDLRRC